MDNSKHIDIMRKLGEDVKHLGSINLNGEKKEIYLKIEKQLNERGTVYEIEKYYTENGDFLAGNNGIDGIPLTLDKKYADDDKLLEQLKEIDKQGTEDLKMLEEERIRIIADSMGVKPEEIKGWQEIDADQEIDLDKERAVEEKMSPNQNDNKSKELSKEQTEKLDIREKTRADQYIRGNSLANKLKLSEHGITGVDKIARAVTKNGEDRIVAVLKDGSAIILGEDILKKDPRKGTNYSQKNISIDSEGGKIEFEASTSRYMIPGTNGEYLEFGWDGDRSGKEIRYGLKSFENQYISIELKNTSISVHEDHDNRNFRYDNGEGRSQADNMIDKVKSHIAHDGINHKGEINRTKIEDLDRRKDNDTHKAHDDEDRIYEENPHLPDPYERGFNSH